MTHAYFSCDCESVMNDLFSTFNRYNGGSLSLKSYCETVCICYSDSSLSALLASFEVSHSGTNILSLFLRRSLCSAFTVYFHFFSILFCLMLSPFPFALCKYRQLKTCQWWVFSFSFLLFSTFGAIVLWPPHPQLWNPADLRNCIILVALLKLLVHLTCKVLLPAFYWICICLFFFLQQCACI